MKKIPGQRADLSDQFEDRTLTYWILSALDSDGQPMGAGSVTYSLQKQGGALSAPTVGRKLRDLEHQGLLSKVGVDGRVLTSKGRRMLSRLENEFRIESSGQTLLKLLQRSSRKDIIDQLIARRTIEGETATLAAQNITAQGLKKLEELVARQREMVDKGETGLSQDLNLHAAIAQASGNKVLASLVSLLRSQSWLNQVVAAIRERVGSRPVVDHQAIVAAIKQRDPDDAREAMVGHINRLIADVERYWEEVFDEEKSDSKARSL